MTQGRTTIYLRLACLGLMGMLALSARDAAAADPNKPEVVLDTTEGPITIELDRAKAPKTVDNFLKYVDDGFYNNTIFHRVIPGFMAQGGGYTKDGNEKPTRAEIQNESSNGLRNARGTIAMARKPDPNSASAQFFINLKDNRFLDRDQSQDGFGYAVFGKVTSGMETVDKIAAVPTSNVPSEGYPSKPIIIKSAKRK